MAIRILDTLPTKDADPRLADLKKDIKTIIDQRIPVSEIVNPPYTDTSMRAILQKVIRIALSEWRTENRHYRSPQWTCFTIHEHKNGSEKRWFVEFNLRQWDADLQHILEVEEERTAPEE